jgi:hypothetical protein
MILLMTCEDNHILDDVICYLRVKFREVKEKKDDIMVYLGMRVSIKENGIYLDMEYKEDIE